LNKSHIEKLTKGSNWSLAEVVHAIVLLTHFHALTSFVFGCGINDHDDPDAPGEIKGEHSIITINTKQHEKYI